MSCVSESIVQIVGRREKKTQESRRNGRRKHIFSVKANDLPAKSPTHNDLTVRLGKWFVANPSL